MEGVDKGAAATGEKGKGALVDKPPKCDILVLYQVAGMVLVKIGALDAALGVSGVVCLDHDVPFSLFLAAPMPNKGKPLVSWKQCLLLAGIAGG